MDDGLNCGRNVPGSTRQTNALSFYSLGNEVDKGRSRTTSLIYKSIVIGSTDKQRISEVICFSNLDKCFLALMQRGASALLEVVFVDFLTVDCSVSHALPVVEQNSAVPQFVAYGIGRSADLLCDAAKRASVSVPDLDDDALFISEVYSFATLRFYGTL